MGRLPENMRHMIPALKQLDEKNKEIEELKKSAQVTTPEQVQVTTPEQVQVTTPEQVQTMNKCLFEGCDFVGKNANGLRFHSKKHTVK